MDAEKPDSEAAPGSAGGETPPSPRSEREWTAYGLAILAFVAVASAVRWELYPVFVDTYYHMAAIAGFDRAGGLPARAFWEMAPGGRPHIYPPALHAAGHLASLFGSSPVGFVTFVSWAFYPLSFAATWLWLRALLGARAAFFGIALLAGPSAWFWNQTAHTANALTMVAAPLALLALEKERFFSGGVLAFVATAAHPMGLFLPPAIALDAAIRRKRFLARLFVAAAALALYAPWLAHIWANRAFLPPSRLGGSGEVLNHGFQASLLALPLAAAGLVFLARERGRTLGLLGPALGFAVVLPMGFGSRFFTFNVHWPLAALAALGAARALEALESRARLGGLARVAAASLAFLALVAYPSLHARPLPPDFEPGRAKPEPGAPPARLAAPARGLGGLVWFAAVEPSSLARLLDLGSRPEPGFGPPPGVRPGRERPPREGAKPFPRGAGPGPDFRGPGPESPGFGPQPLGPEPEPPGPAGPDFLHRPGAREFFAAVRRLVSEEDVIFVRDPPLASLIAGAAGRSTTSGILRDVSSFEPPAGPADCEFAVAAGGDPDFARPERPPQGFEVAFANDFGTLFRNPSPPGRTRAPPRPVLPTLSLLALAGIGVLLVAADFAGRGLRRSRRIAGAAFVAAAACLAPVGAEALRELRDPPRPSPGARDFAPPRPPPAELGLLHDRIQRAIRETLAAGGDPMEFWAPEDERLFHELVRDGKIDEARRHLEAAIEKLEASPRDLTR